MYQALVSALGIMGSQTGKPSCHRASVPTGATGNQMRNKFINKKVSGRGTGLKEDKQVLDRSGQSGVGVGGEERPL